MSAVQNLLNRLNQVSARLEKVEAQLASGASVGSGSSGSSDSASSSSGASGVHAKVKAFDDLIAEHIPALQEATGKVGSDAVKEQVSVLVAAINEQRSLIDVASRSKKPAKGAADPVFQGLIKECGGLMAKAGEIRNKSHKSEPDWNHLSCISEAIQALSWVCYAKGGAMDRLPAPVVKEMSDPAAFYYNPLLRKYKKGSKDANEDQIKWVNAVKGFFVGLHKYVLANHTRGLWWNPQGGDAAAASKSAAKPAAKPAATSSSSSASSSKAAAPKKTAGTKGLFAALNKGGAVTTGLKKVTKDMQTHKNPNLRAGGTVKAAPKKTVARKWGGAASTKKHDPVFELQGNKWVVEYHNGNKEIVIKETEVKHTVYLYRLENCVVKIEGDKINAITFDSCKRTGVVFNTVVSGVEVINCSRVDVQTTGKVPNFAVDKSSGVQVYLSADAKDAQIVTSKSDSVNVLVPQANNELKEFPVPEQFVTTYVDGQLNTTTVQHE